ncbi:hypothetical protein [Polyangium jinanense]|uniref:Lipoprotein n=1 Tax=Polyangium jinanense TaxID=2829994 RepID=A0A9X3X3W4_9BACT|nr:hypothetical protein [Polyangium jinanense]MDC3955643.1 hypothetical protein [Polyangium jinanense]MDC3982285.1 hypothetical protein [Polyangium jinanense]
MKSIQIALVALIALFGVACGPPPKVLTRQTFLGGEKVYQERIQTRGEIDPATKQMLFDFSVQVCDATETGATNCKETKVLTNVIPQSIY